MASPVDGHVSPRLLERSGSSSHSNGSGSHVPSPPSKETYWAQDSQGGDIVYTTDTLFRCVL